MALDVKYLRGSKKRYEEYLKAGKIVSTNFYYLDDSELYLGTLKLSNQEDIDLAIKNLELKIHEEFIDNTELKLVVDELIKVSDENAYSIKELKERVSTNEVVLRDLSKDYNDTKSDFELRITTNTKDIVDLKTDITTLKTISSGIGGESEPPTIVAAIENAKQEAMEYTDEALSWQMVRS